MQYSIGTYALQVYLNGLYMKVYLKLHLYICFNLFLVQNDDLNQTRDFILLRVLSSIENIKRFAYKKITIKITSRGKCGG